MSERTLVADTDNGARLQERVDDLSRLVHAYRQGFIPERNPGAPNSRIASA